MKAGEAFDPRHERCGFYPQDIVGRLRELTDGQKRLYDRLVRFAGRTGDCFPSQKKLADELGKSERQVRYDLAALEGYQFISHKVREGRRSNTYVFLWHQVFERHLSNTGTKGPQSIADDASGWHQDASQNDPERQSIAGQMDSLSGSPLPLNCNPGPDIAGRQRQCTVDLSGSRLPPKPSRTHKKNTTSLSNMGSSSDETTTTTPWWQTSNGYEAAHVVLGEIRGPDRTPEGRTIHPKLRPPDQG